MTAAAFTARAPGNPDLDALGREGWELVALRGDEWIFKRAEVDPVDRFTLEQRDAALGDPDAHRAVSFIRRSPDPTLQLVRATVLEAVRGDQGSVFVDPASLRPEVLLAAAPPASVSERIARANLETLRREGAERIAALLASFRKP